MSPMLPTPESSTRVRSSAYWLQSILLAAGDHGDLAVVLGGQRDAGVRRDRGDRRDAGHDLEADAGLDAGLRLLGTGGVEERVAGDQADDAAAFLPCLTTTLARAAWVSGWPSSPKPPSTSIGPVGSRSQRLERADRDQVDVLGRLGDDHVGVAQQLDGAHGQQAGVAGPVPTNDDPARGGGRVVAVALRLVCARVMRAASSLAASCVHQVCCAVGEQLAREPVADACGVVERRRWRSSGPTSPPSGDRATARDPELVAVVALDDLGQRAERGGAAGLERGEHGALGRRPRPGWRGRRARRARSTRSASSVRHSTASAPWPGAGSIWSGSSTSVTSSSAAEPGQPGAGEHDGVDLAVARPCASRVSTLPRIADDLEAEAERLRAGRRGAASRCRRGCRRGSSPRVRPSRATSDVARVLARRARRPA